MSADELQARGVNTVADISKLLPAVKIGQLAGSAIQVTVRGIGNFGGNSFAEPRVAFNLDGVYVARSPHASARVHNEEVVRMIDIWNRRSTLRLIVGIGGGIAMLAASARTSANPLQQKPSRHRIDTHHHFLPKIYVEAIGEQALARYMPNGRAPAWSAEAALAMMDGNDIAEGILSLSSGPRLPDAARLLRRCNDEAADLRSRHKGRFGAFASLPLPDVTASLKEIEHSFDTLNADGVILFTNYDGKYLGDEQFAPVLAELNRRRAVVFIHPDSPPYALAGQPPASVLEFPFETTRTVASLLLAGAMRRYPDIRFILSHAGGTIPYLAERLTGALSMNPALAERIGDPRPALRSFYYDTALSVSPSSMAALLAFADPGRILFGTDFPMAPLGIIARGTQALDTMQMNDATRTGIMRGNAAALLGRSPA